MLFLKQISKHVIVIGISLCLISRYYLLFSQTVVVKRYIRFDTKLFANFLNLLIEILLKFKNGYI